MTVPLIALAVLSIIAGFIEWPHNMVHLTLFSDLVQKVLPATVLKQDVPSEAIFQAIAILITLSGIYLGYQLYYRDTRVIEQWKQMPALGSIRNFWYSGWRFDQLYDAVFVRPFVWITRLNKADFFDQLYNGIASGSRRLNQWFSFSQNGSLRWYVAGVLFGILFILTLQLIL